MMTQHTPMIKFLTVVLLMMPVLFFGQSDQTEYKKRVLETAEVDYVMSYYTQDGSHASVTGGVGTEKLQDITPTCHTLEC